jgi:hypothetical protein
LNGTLPSELSALSSLEIVTIVGNNLHGTIPSSLGKLTRLNKVQFGINYLTGTFPESMANLPKLEHLYMSYNELTGTLPTILSIEALSFGFNYFTGTIADSVAYPNLRYAFVQKTFISGSLPKSFFSPKLIELDLWDNQLSGSLSDELVGSLELLSFLDLSANDMTGTIPTEIGLLYNLEKLYLDSNTLRGTIPSQMQSLLRLGDLWLANNQLSGNVPVELASLVTGTLTLSRNNLTGSLDLGYCNQTDVFTKVDADCGGANPEVDCSCCTTCCDSSSGNCTLNKEALCSLETSWFENPNGYEYYEGAGTVCECSGSENKTDTTPTWSCSDTQCQSCNRNGTVCSINEQYQASIGDDGRLMHFQSTFRYVVGRNDTVKIEWTEQICEVSVNGQVCNNCYQAVCPDGFTGVHVRCENVEGAGILDLCAGSEIDDEGPLVVFSFQDPALVQGCPPRIYAATLK